MCRNCKFNYESWKLLDVGVYKDKITSYNCFGGALCFRVENEMKVDNARPSHSDSGIISIGGPLNIKKNASCIYPLTWLHEIEFTLDFTLPIVWDYCEQQNVCKYII